MMTLGSFFSGSGGFELAARYAGIETLWASEIEPVPIRVTRKNFPETVMYGDIGKLDGAKLPAVDIVSGGSPCQDMSIAGRREGLDGERSVLFRDYVRIVKEMRQRDRDEGRDTVRPRFMVWENVPGAFSSNKGEDFRCVLEEIAGIAEPQSQELLFLDLTKASGQRQDTSWEAVSQLPGASWTPSSGESHKDARESTLSQILEDNAQQKYYLSEKACLGILRRAATRGKTLPILLKLALKQQAERMRMRDA